MLLQSYQSHWVLHSWPELCCVFSKRVDIWEIDHVCQVMATIWHHYWVFLLLLKLQLKLRTQIFVQNLSRSLCTFLHLLMHCIQDLWCVQVVAPRYSSYADAWETGIHKIYNVSGQVSEVTLTCFSWSSRMWFTVTAGTWLLQWDNGLGEVWPAISQEALQLSPMSGIYWPYWGLSRSAFSSFHLVSWSFHNML